MKTTTRQNFRNRYGRTFNRTTLGLLAGLFAIIAGPLGQAQDDLPFLSGSDGSDGALAIPAHPTNREHPAMGYDSTNGTLVLFGGNSGGTYYPETWTTSDPADGWDLIATDTFVSARNQSAMAWDGTNNNLVLFGGHRADAVKLNDMWTWDGTDWTEVVPTTRPPARYLHSMVADPATGDIYLYGGRSAANAELNDLWIWDGTDWEMLAPTGTAPAHNYQYSRAAWDASDSALIVFNSNSRRTWKYKAGAWTELAIATTPAPGHSYIFHYSAETQSCIMFGGTSHTGQTWEFRDDEWILLAPAATPNRRYYHASAYHTGLSELVITQGWMDTNYNGINSPRNYDTWLFKDDTWAYASGRIFNFDMSVRENGIWNYTSINVPYNSEVRFNSRNASNTPVVWLATENVIINGILRLDGVNAAVNNGADNYARGGPGGAPGGLGAIRFDVSGNYAGTPGQGPGGGAPGVTASQYGSDGQFRNTYGNSLLLPLTGGSGGGGGASNASINGGHGAGGGGGILIASDRDITVNGHINADGGNYVWSGTSYGGKGSGGGIKLMADRINGNGVLWARGGRTLQDDAGGRIRLEAFFRPLAANALPPATATAPTATPDFTDLPILSVISVDGENVTQPPTGNLQTPDVVFTDEGLVTIVVEATNIPIGTPVTLRITSSGEIITLPTFGDPDIVLNGSLQATFSTIVPAGLGTIQAFSEFTPE